MKIYININEFDEFFFIKWGMLKTSAAPVLVFFLRQIWEKNIYISTSWLSWHLNFLTTFFNQIIYIWLRFIFVYQKSLLMNISNRFLSTKPLFELVFSSCKFRKVILQLESWCEMFILKLSGIQRLLNVLIWDCFS